MIVVSRRGDGYPDNVIPVFADHDAAQSFEREREAGRTVAEAFTHARLAWGEATTYLCVLAHLPVPHEVVPAPEDYPDSDFCCTGCAWTGDNRDEHQPAHKGGELNLTDRCYAGMHDDCHRRWLAGAESGFCECACHAEAFPFPDNINTDADNIDWHAGR